MVQQRKFQTEYEYLSREGLDSKRCLLSISNNRPRNPINNTQIRSGKSPSADDDDGLTLRLCCPASIIKLTGFDHHHHHFNAQLLDATAHYRFDIPCHGRITLDRDDHDQQLYTINHYSSTWCLSGTLPHTRFDCKMYASLEINGFN